MAVIMATYDLRKPDHDYQPLYNYLKTFTYCWRIESVWLLDTNKSPEQIADGMWAHVHNPTDKVFACQLQQNWTSYSFPCSVWLKSTDRTW
jgi:hypothetical protein